jgi:hypothetical protein
MMRRKWKEDIMKDHVEDRDVIVTELGVASSDTNGPPGNFGDGEGKQQSVLGVSCE